MIDHSGTLNRFVLRARRIQAHSLASDRQALLLLSELTLTGHIGLDDTVEMRRVLPDEEVFESLAARVRPVLVKTESVHHKKVLAAIQVCIDATELEVPEDLLARLADLQDEWSRFDLDSSTVQRLAVQSARADGSGATPQVSDTQLAAAWLYGDLVHVDTRGAKSAGLLFPLKERYSAAVTYFAHAAVLSLKTADLVMALHELEVIDLADESLVEKVVVGVDELVDVGTAYVGPVGTPMPSLDIASHELPEGFRPFTVTDLLRQTPANQVQVLLTAEDGSVVVEYEAAASRRGEKDGRLHWEALVAGAVAFEVSIGLKDDEVPDWRFEGTTSRATTNRMNLAEAMMAREMARSSEISFHVAGQKFFALTVPPYAAEEVTHIGVSIDTLCDLIVIENITGQTLKPLSGTYRNAERAQLRRTRLLWEGQVVPFQSSPLPITAPAGVIPSVIASLAATFSIADTEVPSPLTHIRHPLMIPESVTGIADSDPRQVQMTMVIPLEEPFIAWAPEKRQVTSDEDLLHPTPWDLLHFDQQAFLGLC